MSFSQTARSSKPVQGSSNTLTSTQRKTALQQSPPFGCVEYQKLSSVVDACSPFNQRKVPSVSRSLRPIQYCRAVLFDNPRRMALCVQKRFFNFKEFTTFNITASMFRTLKILLGVRFPFWLKKSQNSSRATMGGWYNIADIFFIGMWYWRPNHDITSFIGMLYHSLGFWRW